MGHNGEKATQLAKDVLILSRNTLLVHLRYLDMALCQLEPAPIDHSTLMTDGKYLLFHPRHILENYQAAPEIPVRDYLHTVMHCLFRHMFMSPNLNRPYWDLACDIAVENVITELALKSAAAPRERQQAQYIQAIKQELKAVTAEKIYHYLCRTGPDPKTVSQIRGLFYGDDHHIWYRTEGKKAAVLGRACGYSGEGSATLSQVWKKTAERMQVDLETFSKQAGNRPGALTQNLRAINRERYDYTAFLKKFAVPGEVMKLNHDEFDYIFYTYGMELYGNMPLIEPLEYKETKAIREFVIAIDTSGSVSGELVQAFIRKTYHILKSTESFFTKINLHIIQCDAHIQEDKKITGQEDLDAYLKTMQIRGLGGTDFRPVFAYVEQLRQNKEFTNLKGLIYFTDGHGTFPERKPDYDTAFLFVEDDYNNPEVPPWAIKLVLQKDEQSGEFDHE